MTFELFKRWKFASLLRVVTSPAKETRAALFIFTPQTWAARDIEKSLGTGSIPLSPGGPASGQLVHLHGDTSTDQSHIDSGDCVHNLLDLEHSQDIVRAASATCRRERPAHVKNAQRHRNVPAVRAGSRTLGHAAGAGECAREYARAIDDRHRSRIPRTRDCDTKRGRASPRLPRVSKASWPAWSPGWESIHICVHRRSHCACPAPGFQRSAVTPAQSFCVRRLEWIYGCATVRAFYGPYQRHPELHRRRNRGHHWKDWGGQVGAAGGHRGGAPAVTRSGLRHWQDSLRHSNAVAIQRNSEREHSLWGGIQPKQIRQRSGSLRAGTWLRRLATGWHDCSGCARCQALTRSAGSPQFGTRTVFRRRNLLAGWTAGSRWEPHRGVRLHPLHHGRNFPARLRSGDAMPTAPGEDVAHIVAGGRRPGERLRLHGSRRLWRRPFLAAWRGWRTGRGFLAWWDQQGRGPGRPDQRPGNPADLRAVPGGRDALGCAGPPRFTTAVVARRLVMIDEEHCPSTPYPPLPCPTLTLPHPSLPHLTIPHSSLPHLTLPYPTLPYLPSPYHTPFSPTLPYATLPHPTQPWP